MKRFYKFSLRQKFVIFAVFIAIIPMLLVGGLSYVKSIEIIEEKVSQSNYNTVGQVANNINLLLLDMSSSSLYLWQNKDFMHYIRMPEEEILQSPNNILSAQNSLNNFAVFKTDIYSIYIMGYNGWLYDSASADNYISEDLKQQLTQLRGEGVFVADVVTNYDMSQTRVISFVKVLKDYEKLSRDLAIIKINVEEPKISQLYNKNMISDNGEFFIIDEQGIVISSLNKDVLGTSMDEKYNDSKLYTGSSGYFTMEMENRNFIVTYFNLSPYGWKLVNLVPLDELSEDSQIIQQITLFMILVSLGICLLVIIYFSTRVLAPLRQLRKVMKHLEDEDFSVKIDVKGNDEIALLGRSFNKMSDRLDELINEVYTVQIKQKEAELKALQAQINPHFLYNTLDTIYWMCRMENAEGSSDLVQALSKLFRLCLNNGNEFSTVKNEMEHLECYLLIQQKRFEDMISFTIDVSAETRACKVVKLVLQPLVENAIHHGIEKKGIGGKVDIHIFREDGNLIYTITDDGVGADENEINGLLKKVREGNRGFGLKNVNDRIRIYFGNEYGLQFQSRPGQGTTVTVKQPFILNEQDEGAAQV